MKWVFVDYENVNSLDALKLSDYEWVILFCGPKDKKVNIDLSSIAAGKVPKIEIVRIEKSAKDNLDFHLALYLGRYHELVDENVEFVVFSNDTGFDGIISHMKTLGRKCKKVKQFANGAKKTATKKKVAKKAAKAATKKRASKKVAKKVATALVKVETEELKTWMDSASSSLKETRDEKRPSTQKSLINWLTNQLGLGTEDASSTFESMWHQSYFKLEKNKVIYSKTLLPCSTDE
jgi:hypothetical protein